MKVELKENSDGSIYRNPQNRVVFEKNGTYFALNDDEMRQMRELIDKVIGKSTNE